MNAVRSQDVGDLVRVGDDGGRSKRQHEPGELVDEELRRLQVHVGVDEAGHDVAAARVERLLAGVLTEAGDEPVDDGDIGFEPLAREHREDASSTDDQVGGLVPARDGEAARKR